MTKIKAYSFSAIVVVLTMAFSFVSLPVSGADQPFMKAARADLNKALNNLRNADSDKGGHRMKAMDLVRQAVAKVNQGIAYDRRNDTGLPEFLEEAGSNTGDQPFMERAKDNLKSALDNLERASSDKGGYRADAINLVKQAIDEVKRGIDYDRKN